MNPPPVASSPTPYDAAQQVDLQLLRRVQSQDDHALATLYDRYSRVLYAVALRVVRDPALAEEVMQDVFLRCWNGAATYQPQRGRVAVWLIVMTRTHAIDLLRSRHHRARQREDTPMPEFNFPPSMIQPAPTDDQFLRDAIQSALATLTESQRQAIEMAFYEGMSQSEIATHLDTPLGTVKSRIRDGMARLRHALHTWTAAGHNEP